jgi:hypothetical protein
MYEEYVLSCRKYSAIVTTLEGKIVFPGTSRKFRYLRGFPLQLAVNEIKKQPDGNVQEIGQIAEAHYKRINFPKVLNDVES